MSINVDAAIANYNGVQGISFDGNPANNGQCVQLVARVCQDNGLPVTWADAAYWYINYDHPEAYDRIANDPSDPNQVPQKGDIIIWNTNLPNSGGAGHIAIVVSTQAGGFVSFDTNWGGKYCHLVTHNWSYVLGWLHPKDAAPAPTPQPQEVNMPSLTNSGDVVNLYVTELGRQPDDGGLAAFNNIPWPDAWYSIIGSDEYKSRQANKQAQLDNLSNTINQLNQQITDITNQDNATKADKDAALAKIADLTAQLSTLHDQIVELTKPSPAPPVTPPKNPLTPVPPNPQAGQGSGTSQLEDFISKVLKAILRIKP